MEQQPENLGGMESLLRVETRRDGRVTIVSGVFEGHKLYLTRAESEEPEEMEEGENIPESERPRKLEYTAKIDGGEMVVGTGAMNLFDKYYRLANPES